MARAKAVWRSPRMSGRGVQLTEDTLLFGEFDSSDGVIRRQLAGRDFVQFVSDDAWLPRVARPTGIAVCRFGKADCFQQTSDGGRGRAVASFGIRYWSVGGWVVGEGEGGRFQIWAPDGGLAYERDFTTGGPAAISSAGWGVGQVPLGGEAAYVSPEGEVHVIDAGEASWAADVNDYGLAVGRVSRGVGRAAVFCGDEVLETGPIGDNQEFAAINNLGLAVGFQEAQAGNSSRGFVWFRGSWAFLETLQVDGGPDSECRPLGGYDVNEASQIGLVLQCGAERYAAIWELELDSR